jgi:hypothetical protein
MTTGGAPPPDPAPPNPPTPPDPETEHKKRELSISVASVISSAIVAVLGLVITLVVTLVSTSSDRELSTQEFRREQQIIAYSEMLTATKRFERAQDVIYAQIQTCKAENQSLTKLRGYEEWQEAVEDLGLKNDAITIVGSDDTVSASQNLANTINTIAYSTNLLCDEYSNRVMDDTTTQESVKNYLFTLTSASSNFVLAAREDFDDEG